MLGFIENFEKTRREVVREKNTNRKKMKVIKATVKSLVRFCEMNRFGTLSLRLQKRY